jgi:hypothetical protein
MPGDRHTLDENASKTEPAKLLAVFVVDTDEKELLTRSKNEVALEWIISLAS